VAYANRIPHPFLFLYFVFFFYKINNDKKITKQTREDKIKKKDLNKATAAACLSSFSPTFFESLYNFLQHSKKHKSIHHCISLELCKTKIAT
jgi:CRISPR/Cas system endoribonuclease Cas6 (RAMP superfamily)